MKLSFRSKEEIKNFSDKQMERGEEMNAKSKRYKCIRAGNMKEHT